MGVVGVPKPVTRQRAVAAAAATFYFAKSRQDSCLASFTPYGAPGWWDVNNWCESAMMNQFNTSYTHGMFIEQKNTIKSLSNIWQHFSCLLDEGDCKMCNKFHSQKGFFRADQNGAKNDWQMGWIGCSPKSHCGNSISCIKYTDRNISVNFLPALIYVALVANI